MTKDYTVLTLHTIMNSTLDHEEVGWTLIMDYHAKGEAYVDLNTNRDDTALAYRQLRDAWVRMRQHYGLPTKCSLARLKRQTP